MTVNTALIPIFHCTCFVCNHRRNTLNIVKYNLRTELLASQMTLSGSGGKFGYSWGGGSGVDLAVDEQGLWVLWSTMSNNYRLMAAKIDVYQNSFIQTWNLNTGNLSEELLKLQNVLDLSDANTEY